MLLKNLPCHITAHRTEIRFKFELTKIYVREKIVNCMFSLTLFDCLTYGSSVLKINKVESISVFICKIKTSVPQEFRYLPHSAGKCCKASRQAYSRPRKKYADNDKALQPLVIELHAGYIFSRTNCGRL